MPSLNLNVDDAVELAEMLQFLADWLAVEDTLLSPSLARFADSDAYDLSQLRADLDRFAFLLDGTSGESFFGVGGPSDG